MPVAHASGPIRPRSSLLALLVSAVLATGCASASSPTPASPSTRLSAPASTVPTPAPSSTAPADPALIGIPVGASALTVSDRVRVRSKPWVGDDSALYTPLLSRNAELLILEGPIAGSGYWWYRVQPTSLQLDNGITEGWVAVADHDGTAWLSLAGAPVAGVELARSSVARAAAAPADAKTAGAAINAFGLALYPKLLADQALALDGKNVVFSPTSIAIAFGMARAGARGATAVEMDEIFHVAGWDALARRLNALEQGLAGRNASWTDDGTQQALALRIMNAAFAQRGYPIEQSFLDSIARSLGAGLGLVDYEADPEAARKMINDWVSQQTARRIPELLVPGNVTGATRLFLVNAVYLKATWARPFEESETAASPFTRADGGRVQVQTMVVQGQQDIPVATGSGWRATELRYLGGADRRTPLAMTLIAPDDISSFERSLSGSTLERIVAGIDAERARQAVVVQGAEDSCGTYAYAAKVYLPRFKVQTRGDLVSVLQTAGMRRPFGPGADFSGIVDPARSGEPGLFIKTVIHQANIDVDEKGTEAAAATAIGFDTGGCTGPGPAKVVTIRFDHPFLFAVRDVETGAILFMGRVLDPSVGY
jgi:serpin B